MKKTILAVIGAALTIGFIGCNMFGGAQSPYYPLKVGNKWEYETKITTTIGTADPTDTTFKYESEVISETKLTGKEKLAVWEVKNTVGKNATTKYVRVDKDWVYTYEKLADEKESYKWPNSPKVGDKWTMTTIKDKDTSIVNYEIVADKKTANEYKDCLKVKVTSKAAEKMYKEYENYMYWAPNVGNVLNTVKAVMETVVGTDTTRTTMDTETKLVKYTKG